MQSRQYTEMSRADFDKRNMHRQQEFQQLSMQIGHIQLAIQKDQDQAGHCLALYDQHLLAEQLFTRQCTTTYSGMHAHSIPAAKVHFAER